MYSKYTTPSSLSSHHAHCHLHLVVVASRWHLPCTLCRCRGDGGGHPGSRHRRPHCPPPHCPHPPHGAGWWWWGCCHCCAPRLAHAPRCCSCPHRRLIVVPVPLLIVPLVVVDVLMQAGWWGCRPLSCCHCHAPHCRCRAPCCHCHCPRPPPRCLIVVPLISLWWWWCVINEVVVTVVVHG